MQTRRIGTVLLLSGALAMPAFMSLQADDTKATAAKTDATNVQARPQTVEQHQAIAKDYRKKVDEYRGQAQLHRSMLERYFGPGPYGKAGVIQQDDKWYLDHCNGFIVKANALADSAQELASFHDRKAVELKKEKRP